jgi:hypothetical protein
MEVKMMNDEWVDWNEVWPDVAPLFGATEVGARHWCRRNRARLVAAEVVIARGAPYPWRYRRSRFPQIVERLLLEESAGGRVANG